MRSIETEIFIPATPERVWRALVDFASYPEWNPFFASITGELALGATLDVEFRQGFAMRPRIVELEPGRVLQWHGKLWPGLLFDGRHRFELVAEAGGTRFLHTERFTGLLVPLVGGMLRKTAAGFVALNEALAKRCLGDEATAWDASSA